jgi:hypothetical protein
MSLVAQIDKLAKRVAQQFNAVSATTTQQINALAATVAAQAVTSGANWVRLPDGRILQWGSVVLPNANGDLPFRGNGFVPFPVAFPNRKLAVLAQRTFFDGGLLFHAGDSAAAIELDDNRAGFHACYTDNSDAWNSFYWVAIGE